MAQWQFDLVVTDAAGQRSLPPELRVRAESFLHGLLPASIESPNWTMYGSDGGNRIDINFDSSGCEIGVRIDARSDADDFIRIICVMTAALDCALYSDDLEERIASDVQSLTAGLCRSSAWRYATSR